MFKTFMKRMCYVIPSALFLTLSISYADMPQPSQNAGPMTSPSTPQLAQTPQIIPSPPSIDAKAYVLMDAQSGIILASKNMDEKLPPASLTKMMTMYIISQSLQNGSISLDSNVHISKEAWKMGGSKMFVKVGNDVPVKELVQGIIVDSGNDACVAMAEYVAGSQEVFTQMMNTQAKQLNMNNTNYTDCTGLPHPDHYSTAHDLALLARAIINNHPEDYKWYSQKWFTYNKIRQPNRNRLLWRYEGADGLKTGHTDQAGYCLVASAQKDGMRLITVVLGAPTDEARAHDSIQLLTYGFRFFETHLLYQAGSAVATPRIYYGKNKTVSVGLSNDFYITIPRNQFSLIKTDISLPKDIKAPIQQGQALGQIVVTLKDQTVTAKPLVALQGDAKGGLWRHFFDYFALLFHKWF